ncbi:MAG: spermidine/putrescine ABC transporter substrate-binding protein [Gammaproteobacteria bacterium]|nr:spermidine/putrescine ABC transporter substrate-binding protein [Gammaproteobacteria bacterium]
MKSIYNPNNNQVSRRHFLSGMAGLAATTTLWPTVARAEDELNILVWCDHADPKLIDPFEKKHNVRVNVKTYEGTGTALSIIEQSQPGDWDVFVIDAPDVPQVAKQGILAELNKSDYPWDDIFEQIRNAPYNSVDGKLYAVPEKFGYYGVAYNDSKVEASDMSSADAMWNEKYSGRMAVYDYYFPIIQMIAISQGMKPSDVTIDNLDQVIRPKLLEMKPLVSLVGDIVGVQNALVNGDVDMIIGGAEYTVSVLTTENPDLQWTISDNGGLIWTQGLAIFEDSTKKDLANEFVKWVISPEGQASLATSECYWAMPTNSTTPLSDSQKQILRWDEQQGFLDKSYLSFFSEPELDQAMLDLWTEFLQS